MYQFEDYISFEEREQMLFMEDDVITLESSKRKMDEQKHYDIKRIMDEECSMLKVNDSLVRDINYLATSYYNRSEDHMNFFGGNLTGVHRILFTTEDRNSISIELMDFEESKVRKAVKSLPHIGDDWIRATDPINIGLIYLCYKLHNSSLNQNKKEQAILECLILLQCKFLSSLMWAYFKWPPSEELALAVYDSLSGRYYIKKYKTWYNVLKKRAEDIYLDPKSVHRQVIESFETDELISYMITDIQTRIKSMLLNIHDVTTKLYAKGAGLSSNASMFENEGVLEVKNLDRQYDAYNRYLNDVILEERSFLKQELVDVISDSFASIPQKLFIDGLRAVVIMANKPDKELIAMNDELLIWLFDYFREHKRDAKDLSNLGRLMTNLKQLLSASKTSNASVLKLRDFWERFVKKNLKTKNPNTISGLRLSIMMYIIMRTLTKQYYN